MASSATIFEAKGERGMIHKEPGSTPNTLNVTFLLPPAIWAEKVFLVGEFNDWDRESTPMQRSRDGVWSVTIELPRGQSFQFRYLVDGTEWYNDWHADQYVRNEFGADNSVVLT